MSARPLAALNTRASSSVQAPACVWIGDWDKPDQASSFGLTIRSKDSHPCFHLFEQGFAYPYRSPSVPSAPASDLIAHQVSLKLRGGGKLLRLF
jgi:hypothetical protein